MACAEVGEASGRSKPAIPAARHFLVQRRRIAGAVHLLDAVEIDLGHAAAVTKRPWRLEGTLHREIEERADQVIVLLVESDRRTVAEARIDDAVDGMEAMAPTEDVEDARPDRQAHDIFVLDEGTERQRDVESPDDLREEVVLREVIVLDVQAPRIRRPRYVMA